MAKEQWLIDANVLVEDLEAAKANNGMGALVASTLIRYVKRCTTVDAVEVVHGQWVNPYMNRYGHPCHCCSVCGFKASYQDKNYCPNCGAKMDGGISG